MLIKQRFSTLFLSLNLISIFAVVSCGDKNEPIHEEAVLPPEISIYEDGCQTGGAFGLQFEIKHDTSLEKIELYGGIDGYEHYYSLSNYYNKTVVEIEIAIPEIGITPFFIYLFIQDALGQSAIDSIEIDNSFYCEWGSYKYSTAQLKIYDQQSTSGNYWSFYENQLYSSSTLTEYKAQIDFIIASDSAGIYLHSPKSVMDYFTGDSVFQSIANWDTHTINDAKFIPYSQETHIDLDTITTNGLEEIYQMFDEPSQEILPFMGPAESGSSYYFRSEAFWGVINVIEVGEDEKGNFIIVDMHSTNGLYPI